MPFASFSFVLAVSQHLKNFKRRPLDFPKVQVSFTIFFESWIVELVIVVIVSFLFCWIVPGHESTLAFGLLGGEDGIPVVAMLGRV